jgi:predicted  nucleic acid-binding Zn-ribbon protein
LNISLSSIACVAEAVALEAGNTEFKKRIKKFYDVLNEINKLIEKGKDKGEVDKSELINERTQVLAEADAAFTANRFEVAIELLQKAINITNQLGEDPSEIQAMVDNIKSHLGNL